MGSEAHARLWSFYAGIPLSLAMHSKADRQLLQRVQPVTLAIQTEMSYTKRYGSQSPEGQLGVGSQKKKIRLEFNKRKMGVLTDLLALEKILLLYQGWSCLSKTSVFVIGQEVVG
jgi:hypothetical protein